MPTATPLNSLREESHIMSTLLDVLRQEQQLLVSADIEALPAVTTRKTALVTQMTLLSAQRHRALGKAGFPAEEAGMDAWIAASGEQHIAVFGRGRQVRLDDNGGDAETIETSRSPVPDISPAIDEET